MGKIECGAHRSEIEAVWEKIREKHNESAIKRIALNIAKLEYTRKLWNEVQESDRYYIRLLIYCRTRTIHHPGEFRDINLLILIHFVVLPEFVRESVF